MKNEQIKEITSKAIEQLSEVLNEGRPAFRGRFWLNSNVESNLGISLVALARKPWNPPAWE